MIDGSQSRSAWQAIMGVRAAVSQNIDVGLKYRFFNVPNIKFGDETGLLGGDQLEEPLDLAQPDAERAVQLLHASAAASAAAAAASAASAASGDADVPGWLGDPGYGNVPGTASSASAAAAGARARPLRASSVKKDRPGVIPRAGFLCVRRTGMPSMWQSVLTRGEVRPANEARSSALACSLVSCSRTAAATCPSRRCREGS